MKINRLMLPLLALIVSGCEGITSSQSQNSQVITTSDDVTSIISSETQTSEATITSETPLTSETPSTSASSESSLSQEVTSEVINAKPQILSGMKTLNEFQLERFGVSGMPSIGKFNILVVPVEIRGTTFPSSYKNQIDLVFNGTSEATGWESVSSYYLKSSYGKLDITFDVIDKYTTSNSLTKTAVESMGEIGDEYVIAETMQNITGVDFSQYDYNEDGYLDGVIFIYSAQYNYDIDPWWAWVYNGDFFGQHDTPKKNGKELGYYMWAGYHFMNDDTLTVDFTVNAETYIHEVGHMLAMPDLYSTTFSSGPLGDWDMMDYNTGDHGPMNKLFWGWIEPQIASEMTTYDVTLDPFATDIDGQDVALLIPRDNANFDDGDAFDEYLLVMYYTPEGLYRGHLGGNTSIDEKGLAIYRVDARLNNDDFWDFFSRNNQGSSQYLVELLEADYSNSIPANRTNISNSDILRSGRIDLGGYRWNQGGDINVIIEINSLLKNFANFEVTLYQ